jgi:type I restriction enzyme M protein
VEDKWLTTIADAVQGELDRVSQTLNGRIRLLADRYAATLPQIIDELAIISVRVKAHLDKMEDKAPHCATVLEAAFK